MWVQFASKMVQDSFPNKYDMLKAKVDRLQGSTFRLMLSHLELTQNHVLQARDLYFFQLSP